MNASASERPASTIWDRALLDALFREPMSDCIRMLILRDMALIADESGRAPLATLAQRIRNFFAKRRQEGKTEERTEVLAIYPRHNEQDAQHSIELWRQWISDYAMSEIDDLMLPEDDHLTFLPELWMRWTPSFRKALRNIAETRLIEYFDSQVEGGW